MTHTPTKQSLRRTHRAEISKLLLQLNEKGRLPKPELWTWDELDSASDWFTFSAEDRSMLQRICGAFLLAPTLSLWIDSRQIKTALNIIGKPAFNKALHLSTQLNYSSNQAMLDSLQFKPGTPEKLALDITGTFEKAGVAVLRANVKSPLHLHLIDELFGDKQLTTSNTVDTSLAKVVLQNALDCLSATQFNNGDELAPSTFFGLKPAEPSQPELMQP